MEYQNRKVNRLKNYDYSSPGAYFITICTNKRQCLFWEDVGAITNRPCNMKLSQIGKIVDQCILDIPKYYSAISLERYAIMPNHIHLLLMINTDEYGRLIIAPTISTVIKMMKRAASKKIGTSIWQKGFHDHVIRGEQDFKTIWEYIENNPAKWAEDCFYLPEEGNS